MALRRVIDRVVTEVLFEEDSSKLETTDARVQRLRGNLDQMGNSLLVVGTALLALGGNAVRQFANIERGWDRLANRTGNSAEGMMRQYAAASQTVRQETGQSFDDFIRTMTKAESANIKGAQAIEDVTTAMHFQAAQLGDGEAALSTATTIWQTFRKEAAQAGREVLTTGNIIDLIARTAQVGEGNVEDFSMAIKRVAPNAAALGLTETQFAAMVATISQVAPTVDEGSTQLDSFLTSMIKTTPAAERAYKKLGTTITEVRERINRGEIVDVFRELQLAVGLDSGSMGAVRKLIGEGASDTEIEATITARGHSESLDILGDLFGRKEAIRFFLGADHEEISRILGFIEGNFKGLSREASAAVDTLADKIRQDEGVGVDRLRVCGRPLRAGNRAVR